MYILLVFQRRLTSNSTDFLFVFVKKQHKTILYLTLFHFYFITLTFGLFGNFLSNHGNVALIHTHNSNIIKNARITILTIILTTLFPIMSAGAQANAVNIITAATQGATVIIGRKLSTIYAITNNPHNANVVHQLASGNIF